MNNQPLMNATARGVIACIVLVFALACIVLVIIYGEPRNSLHQSALSWSYMLVIFTLIGIGIDSAAATFISTYRGGATISTTGASGA